VTAPTAEVIGHIIDTALQAGMDNTPRSQQSDAGIIGPSELGFCRQKSLLTMKQTPKTDVVNMWPAAVGTAIHNYVEDILARQFPTWLIEDEKITATFPSGVQVPGTPDIIVPEWNACIDIKTVDGFVWVKRDGTSQNHKYQRHTYVMAAVQNGLLDPTKTIYVGNVYFDRSGKEAQSYVTLEEFDPTLTDEIDSWISDVTYAMKQGEDASRDIPAPVCERICPFFGVCRGALPDEEGDLITDPGLISAAELYAEGQAMAKEARAKLEAAKARLVGVSGMAGRLQIRWTHINESTVEPYTRAASDRIDVREVRGR
jgi:hypothetical protein